MKKNSCLQAALDELDAAGIRDIARAHGGKHLQLRWRVNGHGVERMYAVPATPSDHRAAANTRADIRRMLREDGLLVTAPRLVPPVPTKQPDRVALLERRVAALERTIATLTK
jgi:hypothetical protein